MSNLLEIDRLSISAAGPAGPIPLVRSVSFGVDAGEIVGLVGESGAGKSVIAHAIARLLPDGLAVSGGTVSLAGLDLMALNERQMRRVRGRRIAMVFQEPATALNPSFSIGFQVAEALRAHRSADTGGRRDVRREALRLLDRVGLVHADRRLRSYPHQLSGGQRQRVVLAMALACRPEILLADEPTTALDVTTQAKILDLLEDLRRELGLAVLLVTHDLPVIAESCDRVVVLHRGRIIEEGAVEEVFTEPHHLHTRELVSAAAEIAPGENPESTWGGR